MARTTEKKPRRKKIRLRRLVCAAVLVCVSLYTAFLFIRIERGIYAKEKEAEQYRLKLEQEQERAAQLKESEQQVLSDEYYEKIAREKLGLVNVNEQVFVDVSKKNSVE